MNTFPDLKFTVDMFYNKSTFLYGESQSGKGVIITNILYLLKDKIPAGFVFCPTDELQGLYSKRTFPSACVFSSISVDWLEKFWNRQVAISEIYRVSNRLNILEGLVGRIADEDTRTKIRTIRKLTEEHTIKSEGNFAKIEKIRESSEEALRTVYRSHIRKHWDRYNEIVDEISDDEKISLRNYNLNPDVVLVIDDLSSEFPELCKCKFIGDMLTKGRHYRITFIVAIHGDSYVPKKLRTFPMITIFTTSPSVNMYFGKLETITSAQKRDICNKSKYVFANKDEHKKLLYDRDNGAIYVVKADDHRFFEKFGACHLFDYCKKISPEGDDEDTNNKTINKELLSTNKYLQLMIQSSIN